MPASTTTHPAEFSDPARFSFAHGGKDRHPFPVPLRTYDESINVLRHSLDRARLGDATKITANICDSFDAVELLGLRELMVQRDLRKIQAYERTWIARNGGPVFSDVKWPRAERRRPPRGPA